MDENAVNAIIHSILRTCTDKSLLIQDLVEYDTLVELLNQIQPVLVDDPILLRLPADIRIVGDIHGNLDDLLRIFEQCGYPPQARYLFLGDYVDRGKKSIEVITLLFALKYKFPNHIYLLRGNHETQSISRCYGFLRECTEKYMTLLFAEMAYVFRALPIAAVVGDAIFCVHGGISPELKKLEDFEKLYRPTETVTGVFSDMLWSDPSPTTEWFAPNTRGVGRFFGVKALNAFLEMNNLQLLVRSHEVCFDGCICPFPDDQRCVTVFSNSDYCGRSNKAAVLSVDNDLVIRTEIFPHLTPEQRLKRRVILPPWLIDWIGRRNGKYSEEVNDSGDGYSQPEDLLGSPTDVSLSA